MFQCRSVAHYLVVFYILFSTCPYPILASSENNSSLPPKSSDKTKGINENTEDKDDQNSGRIQINVFENGRPKPKLFLFLNDKFRISTDKEGQALIIAPGGLHKMAFQYKEEHYEITLVEVQKDFKTIVLVNLENGKEPFITIEAPQVTATVEDESIITEKVGKSPVLFKGKVLSLTSKEAISGVQVYVRGISNSARTDENGNFTIHVPAGTYSMSFIHPKFTTLNSDNLKISPPTELKKNPVTQEFFLSPSGIKMEEFIVTAPHIKGSMASLLDERRLSEEVTDLIGAEQMSKSGDSDAASALRRVTGLTILDGKYIYVRGLGGRYATVLLNRFYLPSPNPIRRVVPLDMFPTGVLESIVVQKTYSADMPGDFGGGVVNLRTKSLPDKTTASLSLSLSRDEQKEEALFYKGGGKDWLGIDDGTRSLPDLIKRAIGTDQKLKRKTLASPDGFSDKEIELLGESLPSIYNIKKNQLPLSWGGSAAAGSRFNLGNLKLGFLASGLYGDDWEVSIREKAKYQQSGEIYQKDPFGSRTETERLVKLAGSISAGIDFNEDNKIRSFLALLRRTVDVKAIEEGENTNYDGRYRYHLLEWQERELMLGQLWGEHSIPGLNDTKVSWRIDRSRARQYQPDTREYRYEFASNEWRLADRNDGNERRYGDLKDLSTTGVIDVEIPWNLTGQNLSGKVKAGYAKTSRSRNASLRRFGFVLDGLSADEKAKPMEDIVSPENIGFPKGLYLNEKTLVTDNYKARQTIEGIYGLVTLKTSQWLDLNLGIREEKSSQTVETFNLFNADETIEANLDTTHYLPASSATIKALRDLQIRLGYSKTLARPDFRELSASRYIDEETDKVSYGNPDLITTLISNYDVRFEYFPSSNELLSIGGFYKNFKDPIEVRLEGSEMSFENAESAVSYGAELEFGLNLSRLARFAENFKLTGNYTYIFSEVSLGNRNKEGQATQTATSQNRPLQGQAPYTVNLGLFYDNIAKGSSLALLYNRLGPFITGLGQRGSPDEYEQSRDQIDLIIKHNIGDYYKVSLKINNLLAADQIRKEEDRITLKKNRDRSYSVSLTASF